MADWTRREVTTTCVEYILPNPTNWAELGKVITAVTHDVQQLGISQFDDTVRIEGRDDEIVISYLKGGLYNRTGGSP